MRRGFWIIWRGPKSNGKGPCKWKTEIFETEEEITQGEEDAETGVMLSQTNKHQGMPTTPRSWKKQRTDCPLGPPEGRCGPAHTLILPVRPLELWENKISVVLSHHICGVLFWQPQKTSTLSQGDFAPLVGIPLADLSRQSLFPIIFTCSASYSFRDTTLTNLKW